MHEIYLQLRDYSESVKYISYNLNKQARRLYNDDKIASAYSSYGHKHKHIKETWIGNVVWTLFDVAFAD